MADRWSDMLDELSRQRAEVARVGDALRTLTAHAVSPDRLVSVTVDARGLLVDLGIDQRAMRRLRADQLSEQITVLVRDADRQLTDRRNQILAAAVQPVPDYADVRLCGDGPTEASDD
ncbi:YbaB/EbfC family nucleoid-associated protein [Gordonia sp. ABSL11-1]|uniref:YbaB/EbfC family nucleoid-associated protein n=1 Tax=Gordonia sp. ABSL11-1 TaxID=3053924 RepID=UPI002573D780|nr:YbaB/EbfC family nucleoid-associated protein [Gordonia sp. ABSL11-1]MDL9944723.1 YbaB/EbfC family nucleoid-associated protein [Gordonia sp. ABSL11-1]